MRSPFYRITRDLHLYLGLFISPFVLVFSISVFFLVHTWLPGKPSGSSNSRTLTGWKLPEGVEKLSGQGLIDALKPALEKAGVRGEIGFVRHLVKENQFIVPVIIPGRQTTVTISIVSGEATVVSHPTGLASALVVLHKFPGPHAPSVRNNWVYMKAWSWMADATVYLVLFITISGIYLWYVLRAERKVGFILILSGGLIFFGMAYALSH